MSIQLTVMAKPCFMGKVNNLLMVSSQEMGWKVGIVIKGR